jgi:2-iminobutanoate/2-iminopropanoate deaminase
VVIPAALDGIWNRLPIFREERITMNAGTAIGRVAIDEAPKAIGPYSQAVSHGGVLYCSGQIPLDPATGAMADGSIEDLTRRCLSNLSAICESEGTSLERALKLTVYVIDLDDFGAVNEAYASFFPGDVPARTTVQVSRLPAGARVEIDAIVALTT